ncbi:hypothetical protein [Cellulomonas sp.]|uniref:hypothetical protein n=1 Tax=Cellulomonas sp. TaxID=40001 RepID=UPI003BA97818
MAVSLSAGRRTSAPSGASGDGARAVATTGRADVSGSKAQTRPGHVEIESAHGRVAAYARHPNGGGLVEVTARVHVGATVHESAYVEAGAVVGDGTHIGASSWIDSDVMIGARVHIGRNVHLGAGSRVADGAQINAGARIGEAAVVATRARVSTDTVVPQGAVVLGPTRRSPRSDFGTAA